MSLLNNSNAISTGGGYNLENSLRFRSSASAYLNRTPTVASNRKTFTISLWMKGSLESSPALFQARESSSTGQPHFVLQSSNGSLYILDQNAGTQAQIITTAVFRDPSAWYHIVVAIDTTEAIAADRAKIYVNSEKLESFSTLDTFPLNYDTAVNNTVRHLVGARMPNSSFALIQYLDGYLTEVNFVDGQALTPSDFGDYNEDTGVWQPIKYEGTYGTNGFYLPMNQTVEAYSADYLVVAGGGGGGGRYYSGGGGAGGYLTGTTNLAIGSTYTVTVGAGGSGGTGDSVAGSNGQNSVFNSLTAIGGGGGGSYNSTAKNGLIGGSGGGGSGYAGSGGAVLRVSIGCVCYGITIQKSKWWL